MRDPSSSGIQPVLLIGAGRMGSALLEGWLAGDMAARVAISVIEPHPSPVLDAHAEAGRIRLNPDLSGFHDMPPALTVLAIKPQLMDDALVPLRPLADSGGAFVSIAAGKSIASIRAALGGDARLVRAMPNTPASVARGITACFAGADVDAAARDLCTALLEAVGAVVWLEDETLMDAVTAVSGSGPAYLFHMAEALAEAGTAVGLPEDLAQELARVTVAGAGEMLWQGAGDASSLRANVTSPGGTTAAALAILMADDGLRPLVKRAVIAARDRGRALDQG